MDDKRRNKQNGQANRNGGGSIRKERTSLNFSDYDNRNIKKVPVKNKKKKNGGIFSKRKAQAENEIRENRNVVDFERKRNTNISQVEEKKVRGTSKRTRTIGKITRNVAILLFMVIIVYLGVIGYNFATKQAISYDTVLYGTIDTPKTAEGIIIRDEKVYKAPASGIVSYDIADDEKVKKGTLICNIKDESVVSSMEENLADIDKSILDMQASREDISVFSEDVKKINNQIKDIVDTNSYTFSQMDIGNIYNVKKKIQDKIDTRNQMLLSENKGSLQELANQRAEQANQINENTKAIYAENGGIVVYGVDGLEETLTISSMGNITKDQTTMKSDMSTSKTQVSENDNVFKIVNNNTWYIVSYIPTEYLVDWDEGDIRNIYIKNGADAEAVAYETYVDKLIKSNNESYVVFRVTKDIMDFIDVRNIEFELNKSRNGYKIPNSAIVEKTLFKIPADYIVDNKVLKENGSERTEITINNSGSSDDGFIYTPVDFSSLKVSDILLNPKDKEQKYTIGETASTNGIYIMNTGIAEFKKINMENSLNNSTHTIIDPNLNSNIRLYDRVISDSKNIEKEELLYKN